MLGESKTSGASYGIREYRFVFTLGDILNDAVYFPYSNVFAVITERLADSSSIVMRLLTAILY